MACTSTLLEVALERLCEGERGRGGPLRNCRLQIADCRLTEKRRRSDVVSWSSNLQSAISNLQLRSGPALFQPRRPSWPNLKVPAPFVTDCLGDHPTVIEFRRAAALDYEVVATVSDSPAKVGLQGAGSARRTDWSSCTSTLQLRRKDQPTSACLLGEAERAWPGSITPTS